MENLKLVIPEIQKDGKTTQEHVIKIREKLFNGFIGDMNLIKETVQILKTDVDRAHGRGQAMSIILTALLGLIAVLEVLRFMGVL